MRASTLLLWLWCTSALANSWSGVVLSGGKPVANARVEVFVTPAGPMAGCEGGKADDLLGTCTCPARQAAFTTRALAGLPSAVPVATTTSGADGAFTVTAGGTGRFALKATASDAALAAIVTLTTSPVKVELTPTEVARVVVTGVSTGAVVSLLDPRTGEVARFATEGRTFVSPPLPAGSKTLLTVAPGAMPFAQGFFDGTVMGRFRAAGAPIDVTLSAPGQLRGVVVDGVRPAAGATVLVDPERCQLKAKTDADGRFSVPSPLSPPYLTTVIAQHQGKVANGTASTERFTQLLLQREAKLELTVVDPSGKPVPDVRVWVTGQQVPNLHTKTTDAMGRWALAGLTDGEANLHILERFVLLSSPRLVIKGATAVRVVVQPEVLVMGRVVDAQKRPLNGVTVSPFFGEALQESASDDLKAQLRSSSARTDATGDFTLHGLIPGAYELVAKSEEFGEATAVVTAPGSVEVTLETPFVIEGQVADPQGQPMADVDVSVVRPDDKSRNWWVKTNAAGRFRCAVKAPGNFEVTAGSVKQQVKLPGKPLSFVVPRATPLRGTVVNAAGAPVAGAVVQSLSLTSPAAMMLKMARMGGRAGDPAPLFGQGKLMHTGYAEVTTEADGSFSLPPGDAMLMAGFGGARSQLVEASSSPVTLKLETPARVVGRLLDPRGVPVERFMFNGQPVSSVDGGFDLAVAGGAQALRFDDGLSVVATREVTVPAAPGVLNLGDVKLERGFWVTGRVVTPAGAPLVRQSLHARSGTTQPPSELSNDGTFRLSQVPAGKLEVSVTSEEFAPATAVVDVKAQTPEVVLTLQKWGALEVTVLRNGDGEANQRIEAEGPSRTDSANRRSVETHSDGRAQLQQLVPGTWTVVVGREKQRREVKVVSGQTAKVTFDVR